MSYVRLYETTDENQLNIIKLGLNNENVQYRVLFEELMRTTRMEGIGHRGAIIEVHELHAERAKTVLEDAGVKLDYDRREDVFPFMRKFENLTDSFPLLSQLPVPYRLLIVSFLLAAAVFLSLIYVGLKS